MIVAIAGYPAYSESILKYYASSLEKTCFETDNRTFDKDENASARITVEFMLKVRGREISTSPVAGRDMRRVGETKHVNCKTGASLGPNERAPISGISIGDVKKNGFLRTLFVDAGAANPFFNFASIGLPSLSLSPKIDFSFSLTFDPIKNKVELKGTTGTFPSFEAYASINNGPVQIILQRPPADGATTLSLFDFSTGINSSNFSGIIALQR